MAETMDTCVHLFPDAEDIGRTALDQALAIALAEQDRTPGPSERAAAGQRSGGGRVSL